MNKSQLLILMIPVVLFSLTAHEYSHGRIAFLLGDNTAQRLGRLSFNPLKHLDPIGTLFFYFMGFGWAKPVPVDPGNFDRPRRDMMYVAIAGPLCNLVLAVACSFFIRIIEPYDSWVLFTLLSFGVYINVALAIFNLLPIHPLDGGQIFGGYIQKISPSFSERLRTDGPKVLFAIIILGYITGHSIIWYLISPFHELVAIMAGIR